VSPTFSFGGGGAGLLPCAMTHCEDDKHAPTSSHADSLVKRVLGIQSLLGNQLVKSLKAGSRQVNADSLARPVEKFMTFVVHVLRAQAAIWCAERHDWLRCKAGLLNSSTNESADTH
jgi:hypothetical protein